MKRPIALLLLSIGLAFATGYLSLQLRQSERPGFGFSSGEMASLKRHFRENHRVAAEVSTLELFPANAGLELIDPRNALNPSRDRSFSQVSSVFRALKLCQPHLIHETNLKKAKTWIRYRCHLARRLPAGFFEKPPFLFPLGTSFAKLAVDTGQDEFKNPQWIKAHLGLFHALELKELPDMGELDPKRQVLKDLEQTELLALASGQGLVVTPAFLLVKKTGEWGGDNRHPLPTVDYLIYPRPEWDQFLGESGIETLPGETTCLSREEGLCWTRSPLKSQSNIRWTVGLLFVSALGLILFCVWQMIRMIQSQKLEEERKRFALQALTHELRTPLASLVLSSEQMLGQFDALPASMQGPFLRLSDDVQRLTRVAESSHHYLSAPQSGSIVSFTRSQIPSVNDFTRSVLERYEGDVLLRPLDLDSSFQLDPYWVGVCLQNLVQNACLHGQKPILVRLQKKEGDLIIAVSDQGEIAVADRSRLLEPFFKRNRSSGLGLGLTIVETVMKSINGRLKVSFQPTTFELWIKDGAR